jgi:glutamate dehydrogenase
MLDKSKSEKRIAERIEKIVEYGRQTAKGDQQQLVEAFTRQYFARVPHSDLIAHEIIDLHGAAMAHLHYGRKRAPGKALVHAYNPRFDKHGWQSTHTVLEIVADDTPFLVDSVAMQINSCGFTTHLTIHPIMRVVRNAKGVVKELVDVVSDQGQRESFMQFQLDRQTDPETLKRLESSVRGTLEDVYLATGDWGAMRQSIVDIMSELENEPPPRDAKELAEVIEFCRWIEDGHFTFLGYCRYEMDESQQALVVVDTSICGLLKQQQRREQLVSGDLIPMEVQAYENTSELLIVAKANTRSTVHRSGYLDFIGLKRLDANGKLLGIHCIFGLFTSAAYRRGTRDIPMLRHKVARIIKASGLIRASHEGKALDNILESYPRDELVQASDNELLATAMSILELQERQRIRLFQRRDSFGRYHACLVYVPREKYSRELRLAIQDILVETLEGESVEFDTLFSSESVLARIYYVIHTTPDSQPRISVDEIERRLVEAARSWQDQLRTALFEQFGEERGNVLFDRYGDAFPASYREDFSARTCAYDIQQIEQLAIDGGIGMHLYTPLADADETIRFKLFSTGGAMSLSEVLPVIENMGVKVGGERPYAIAPAGLGEHWIHEFDLRYDGKDAIDTERVAQIFQDAFARVWYGEAENDGFNRLVLGAGLNWRDTVMLRAYCKFLLQLRVPFSQDYMIESLVYNSHITRLLTELFHLRLDPARQSGNADRAATLTSSIEKALEDVENLDQDRILRCYLEVIQATLRCNFFQPNEQDEHKSYLSFKFDPSRISRMPLPKPKYEIFVYSPRVEAVHLRGGSVARGGLRWSDRREDFRTEVLGLVKAQMVKNAVIVPVGSKGGFVCKRLPNSDREAIMNEVVDCYKTFMSGMLDITDNLVSGEIVPPLEVVRYDGDDPYLVIAADKGTATFSDIANGVADDYGFWLGDAYASGGSVGYDHKKMGITARGAWESVKRHFRELGVNVQTTDFSVVGIGDMGGDVFGNGMLLSRHIKLVAAFNHMHVFLDPDPDPEKSFVERERLFNLPRSSWEDYDTKLISAGGGVFSRRAKSIALSEQAKQSLGIKDDALPPNELIHLILQAKVDLVWNGGIGTYVKASSETHEQVSDRANDPLRVNGAELRCKVFGEGGNLGVTQLGRIEFAENGGRMYTDSIDNSAGVDCSDHEVNIKILLNAIVANGDMTSKQRNRLLADMTDEVGDLVLRDNYAQTQAISIVAEEAPKLLDEHARFMRAMEHEGALDRAIEYLPNDELLAERAAAQEGLTRPELAILLSYSKMKLYDRVLESEVPEAPFLASELESYFPAVLSEKFASQVHSHRLKREIIATQIINDLVNRLGPSFEFRISEETGATAADIVRAYAAARAVFDLPAIWETIESLDNTVSAHAQIDMMIIVRGLLERAILWLLRNRRGGEAIGAIIDSSRAGVQTLRASLPRPLDAESRLELRKRTRRLAGTGVPEELAARISQLVYLSSALDIVDVASRSKADVARVAGVYFELGARLELQWLREQVAYLTVRNNWHNLAKSALRHDLHNQQRILAAQAMATGSGRKRSKDVVDQWMKESALEVVNELKAGGQADFAMLSVALNEVRSLVQARLDV